MILCYVIVVCINLYEYTVLSCIKLYYYDISCYIMLRHVMLCYSMLR